LELHYQLFDPLPCLNLGQILAYPLNLPFDSRRARDYQPTFSSSSVKSWTGKCWLIISRSSRVKWEI
jgi:hypothetical protein